MNENPTKIKGMTLDEISLKKESLRIQIEEQKCAIAGSYQRIIDPFSLQASGSSFLKNFSNGLLIFDGVMMGIKVIKRIKKIFKR